MEEFVLFGMESGVEAGDVDRMLGKSRGRRDAREVMRLMQRGERNKRFELFHGIGGDDYWSSETRSTVNDAMRHRHDSPVVVVAVDEIEHRFERGVMIVARKWRGDVFVTPGELRRNRSLSAKPATLPLSKTSRSS